MRWRAHRIPTLAAHSPRRHGTGGHAASGQGIAGRLGPGAAIVAAGVITMSSLTGCTDDPAEAPQPLAVDVTSAPAGASRGAALNFRGALDGRVAGGRACLWVTAPDGTAISLVWPAGSTARPDPLRVLAPDGTVLATVGDRQLPAAGYPDPAPGCHGGGTTFVIGAVQR
ncbi:MAG: hypothetical protein ACRC35_06045 [Angustibacter sp.]